LIALPTEKIAHGKYRALNLERRRGIAPTKTRDYCPHIPTPRQQVFLGLTDEREVFFGGAAAGGKSDALLMAYLQFVHKQNYDGIIFRRTYANLSKPGALMDRSLTWFKPFEKDGVRWNEQKKLWTFPSGARLQFGHMDSENDKFNYQSAEFQYVAFDELTEFTESQYRFMFSRLRKSAEVDLDIPLRMRSASNPPQDPGGEWVQKYFVPDDFFFDDADEPVIRKEVVDEEGKSRSRVFVPSRLEHNPHVDEGDYDESLSYLDDVTRHRLRLGDWRIKKRGEILWMYSEDHTCITWSEFAAVIGKRQIPNHWLKRVYQDVGTTIEHPNVISYFATAGANAPMVGGVSLSGMAFLYRGRMTYQTTTDDIGKEIWADITPGNEFDTIEDWQMSHEGASERLAYNKQGLPFRCWETGKTRGITQLQNALDIRDKNLPHPFKPALQGHPMLFFIIDDDQVEFPKDDLGLARWRAEAAAYKWARPKSGDAPAILYPHPLFNDACDTMRAAAFDYFPTLKSLSHAEEIEARMPEHLKQENVSEYYGEPGFAELTMARIQEERQIKQRMEAERQQEQEKLVNVFGPGRRAVLLGGRRRR
jgi:hypothetical protein